jgi:hypothetical protein
VARTLVDLATSLDIDELARACHEAGVKHKTTPVQVEEVLARRPNSPGAGKLRRIIRGEAKVKLSKLESGFVDVLGYTYHSSWHAWEREREARRRGDEFRRFTHGDVFKDRAYMLRELFKLLRRRDAGIDAAD